MSVFSGPQSSPKGAVFNFDCLNPRCTAGSRPSGVPYKDLVSNKNLNYALDGRVTFANYVGGYSPSNVPQGTYQAYAILNTGSPNYGNYGNISCTVQVFGFPQATQFAGAFSFNGGAYITNGAAFQMESVASGSNLFFDSTSISWNTTDGSYPTQGSSYPFAVECGGNDWMESDPIGIGTQDEPFSIETIVKPILTPSSIKSLISLRSSLTNLNYFDIAYDNLFGSDAYFMITASNGQYSVTDFGNTISGSDFYHVVATYGGSADGHLVRLYINGKSYIANTFGSMGGMTNSRLYVARSSTVSGGLGALAQMDLGMLRAYNRALTSDEVENAYYATIGKYRT